MDRSKKLNLRDGWYYGVISPADNVKIIAEAVPLKEVLREVFEANPSIFRIRKQSIYLVSGYQSQKQLEPTVVYFGNNLYGTVHIVTMDKEQSPESVDLMTLSSVVAAIDSLWFPQTPGNKTTTIEVIV
jgi:hypothetical protein